jgi:hypothetical protein
LVDSETGETREATQADMNSIGYGAARLHLDNCELRKEVARLREYLHVIEDAPTLELAVNQAALALYM